MREYLVLGIAVSFLLFPFAAEAQDPPVGIVDEGPDRAVIYAPDAIEWQDGPGSFEPGAQFAVLEGDPGERGVFTVQIRMPDEFVIAPHSHPGVERVTVISGTFRLGHGDTLDRDRTQPLPPGSYFSLPPGMRHYAVTEGETVIQLSSIGPWDITYVNPEDDPRGR